MNKLNIKLLIPLFFLLCFVFVPILMHADSAIMLQQSEVEVQTVPENPEPYQDVRINLVSYSTDLNKAMITWVSGPKTVLSGYGKTSYSFTASGPNTTTVIDITIVPSDSLTPVKKEILISPSEVGLIWEAVDSYTPPFYKGKALLSREGLIKVVAIPSTNDITQGKGNVTYTWKLNGSVIQNASGFNKDSYLFQNNLLNKSENVTVTVSSIDNRYNATKTITIPTISPKIIFYEKSPTEGILYNKALSNNILITKKEITIEAEPYFLDFFGNNSDFSYAWNINGNSIKTPSSPREITLTPSSNSGYATIGLTMENLRALFQTVKGQLKINL